MHHIHVAHPRVSAYESNEVGTWIDSWRRIIDSRKARESIKSHGSVDLVAQLGKLFKRRGDVGHGLLAQLDGGELL